MKINVFKTQCKIGSSVKYKQKTRKVVDINRSTNEVCLDRRLWVRCTEVELLTSENKASRKGTRQELGNTL